MIIRRFVKGLDDSAWANLTGVDSNEFRESMLDLEFSDVGMFVANEFVSVLRQCLLLACS